MILIDAGHGGKDKGAVVGDYVESDLNLAIALHVQKRIPSQVKLSRADDSGMTLEQRRQSAEGCCAIYSIHHDIRPPRHRGGLVLLPERYDPATRVAGIAFMSSLAEPGLGVRQATHMYPRAQSLLRALGQGMPAMLLEVANLTSWDMHVYDVDLIANAIVIAVEKQLLYQVRTR
jgi:N-acetylmuramoyl-L-alanine amidase